MANKPITACFTIWSNYMENHNTSVLESVYVVVGLAWKNAEHFLTRLQHFTKSLFTKIVSWNTQCCTKTDKEHSHDLYALQ